MISDEMVKAPFPFPKKGESFGKGFAIVFALKRAI
jgi:hypothetical protein